MTAALTEIATRIRAILEAYGRSSPADEVFSRFPDGCCGDTALSLGCYLVRAGYTDVEYVGGWNDRRQSHAWTMIGGLVIDITADQFDQPGVIVTSERDWHRNNWNIELQRSPVTEKTKPPNARVWRAILHGMKDFGGLRSNSRMDEASKRAPHVAGLKKGQRGSH
jgi:hypothetical protein